MEMLQKPIHVLVEEIKSKKISAQQLTEQVFKQIERYDGTVKAYVQTFKEQALKQALKVDEKIAQNKPLGRLAGIPIAIKDNLCMDGYPVNCASQILNGTNGGYKPPYNATVVQKLLDEDAVIIGTANMDEFAMGSSTENSSFQITRNPWDTERVPGGSSGGSAAAVAADMACAALGSDTGGSIRQPAAFCGVVGLKPIYGEVSRFGLIAFASSLDQIGPITKDVHDSALMMDVIAGHDPHDATSIQSDKLYGRYQSFLKNDVKGLKIGIPEECYMDGLDPAVVDSLNQTKELLQSLGATVETISLPHTKYAVATYYIIATAEASSNLARFDGVQYGARAQEVDGLKDLYLKTRNKGFGNEVKRRILLGTYVLSSGYYDAYYKKAQKVRTLIKRDFNQVFQEQGFDAIIMPTTPTPAFKVGEKTSDPLQMYLSDIFTISVNLAAIPAISIPCGFSKEGMPLGMQVVTDAHPEKGLETLYQVAYTYEQNTSHHNCKPAMKA